MPQPGPSATVACGAVAVGGTSSTAVDAGKAMMPLHSREQTPADLQGRESSVLQSPWSHICMAFAAMLPLLSIPAAHAA